MANEVMEELRRLKQMAIRNSKPMFDIQIAKHSYAAIVELATGEIIHSTTKLNEVFGYESIEGKNIKDLMPERFRGKHDKHLTGYAAHPVEKTMGERSMNLYALHSDGHEFEVAILLSPLPDVLDGQFSIFQVMKTKNN